MYLAQDRFDCFGIVRFTVTFCTVVSDTDELTDRVTLILWAHPADYATRSVEQRRGLVPRVYVPLDVLALGICAGIHISLTPRLDLHCPTGPWKNNRAVEDRDSDRDILQSCVVDDEGACKGSIAGL